MENFTAFQKFFDYQPCFSEDPQDLLQDILSKAQHYLSADDLEIIKQTYEFVKSAHQGVVRLSGEPYVVHPLKATQFLMEINPDLVSIQACLLHDVIEDTEYTYEDIQQRFGTEVADICEGLVKVSKVKYTWEDRSLETLKKTFLAMAKDLRVIFVKFADRIHNIQTLQYHPTEEKKQRIAQETLKVYASIANRLGLYTYQLYLENGSFKILYPEKFSQIMDYIKKYLGDGEKVINSGIKTLTSMLKKEGLTDFSVYWRIKSPFRIYEKMEKKYHTNDISLIMDLLAFKVVTETVSDCYMILGIIHKYYTPLIKKIKDYIAVPKFNGYKSIHTTILGMSRFPTEIQIRTKTMDSIAEYGVAAHYAYSENNASVEVPVGQSEWIQRLRQIVSDYSVSVDKTHFKDVLQVEILDKSIFVYTPKWDIKELPFWSTVLDFAFYIHGDLGLKFKSALVNNQLKPISYQLKTGDIVQINANKDHFSAMKHWVEYLHTPSARSQLLKFIKTQEKLLHLSQKTQDQTVMVDVDNNRFLQYQLCPDCHPKMGDKIIAQTRKDEIKIHSTTCKLLKKISYSSLLEAHWTGDPTNHYLLTLIVSFDQQKGSILQIISLFSSLSIPVIKFEVKDAIFPKKIVTIVGEISNPRKLEYLFFSLLKQGEDLQIRSKSLS